MLLSRISLASLRTFAEVARHGSLSQAAEQLCISPSAVSHQMKLLEQQLDTQLFIRRSRGIELTGAGQRLSAHAMTAMNQLEQGLQGAIQAPHQQLRIAAIPAITEGWLLPRLARFYAQQPDIELTIVDQDSLTDFNQLSVDLHLHFGSGEFIGLKSELLMQEWVVPVCSPSLLAQFDDAAALLQAKTIRRLTYTGFDEDRPGGLSWLGWLNQSGQHLNPNQAVTHFNHLTPLFTAARLGHGIALGWQQLIEPELNSGTLVALSEVRVPLKYSYYAIAPGHHFERKGVQTFMEWIRQECQQKPGVLST